MRILFLWAVCLILPSRLLAADISNYEKCYKERVGKIPSIEEREFLDSYIHYLKSGTRENGEMAIDKMKVLAKKHGGKFSTQWVGVFEGATELCCGGPDRCTESIGSITHRALLPWVKKGWVTATAFVQMYEKLADTDGADASGLHEYLKIIREHHQWAVKRFEKQYF